MTPTQVRTFNELLAIGGPRPTMHPDLPDQLAAKIEAATTPVLARWTETSMWLTKATLFTALRCEGQLKAEPETGPRKGLHPATVVGIVAHRAIQIAHTHPGHTVDSYVRHALEASLQDEDIAEYWAGAAVGVQSDLQMQMMSRVTSFLDSWPVLAPSWTPRFEEPVQAKIGRLTLSARADLVLGRPRSSGQQTMMLCDLKSGSLRDDHFDEAMFYALVSTLRHGVAPFRSTVYSLASGTYTEPDVTAERLHTAADKLIAAVSALVDVRTDAREAVLTPGTYCAWCPLRAECPQAETGASAPARPAPTVLATPSMRPELTASTSAQRGAPATPGFDENVPDPVEPPADDEPDPYDVS